MQRRLAEARAFGFQLTLGQEIGLACFLMTVACAVAYGGLFSHAYPGDTDVYSKYGRALVDHGQIPYRDFYDEYPPGSVPVFSFPAIVWNAHYVLFFKLWMTACAVGFTACVTWTLRRLGLSPLRLIPVVTAPLLMGPLFLNRYDPLPALLGALLVITLLLGRDRASGALLGVATAVKLYLIVCLPVLARRIRSRREAVISFVVGLGVLVLPFFVLAPGGVGYSAYTQAKRHLQIESLGSSFLLVVSRLGIHHEQWIAGKPGSIDLGGGLADVVGTLSSLGSLALIALVTVAFWRGEDTDRRLVTACAATVAAYTVFGKVLSPQYLTWLVPFVPLAAGRRGLIATGGLFVALTCTLPINLLGRWGLRNQSDTIFLLLFRNLVLVAVFWFLYLELRDGVGGARRAVREPPRADSTMRP